MPQLRKRRIVVKECSDSEEEIETFKQSSEMEWHLSDESSDDEAQIVFSSEEEEFVPKRVKSNRLASKRNARLKKRAKMKPVVVEKKVEMAKPLPARLQQVADRLRQVPKEVPETFKRSNSLKQADGEKSLSNVELEKNTKKQTWTKGDAMSCGAVPHKRPGKAGVGNKSQVIRKRVIGNTSEADNTTAFYTKILDWDVKEELRQDKKRSKEKVKKVPSTFESYEQYFSVWEPLAVAEVMAQTMNEVSGSGMIEPVLVSLRTTLPVDVHFNQVKIHIQSAKDGGTAMNRIPTLMKQDLVVFSDDPRYMRQGSSRGKALLGLLVSQSRSRMGLQAKVLNSQTHRVDLKKTYMFRLSSLITAVREFTALCKCRHYPLLPLMLNGAHEPGSLKLDSLGVNYVRWLEASFNESQQNAIKAAATSSGFTLIKGPPGTGKTTTLKGLLNSLHLREYNRYYNAILDVARRPDHETSQAWAKIKNEKPHILVTAPSNIAVDNIISKIMDEGFCDGQGRKYFPAIVRVGRGRSKSLKSVSLEEFIDQITRLGLEEVDQKLYRLRCETQQVEYDSVAIRNEFRRVIAEIEHNATQASQSIPSSDIPAPPLPSPSEPVPKTVAPDTISGANSTSILSATTTKGSVIHTTNSTSQALVDSIPPPSINEKQALGKVHQKEINFELYPAYQNIAQKLNVCLERLQTLKLEIQRYEFVRKMRTEDGRDTQQTISQLEITFLDTAHIVFTTLSSAGLPALDSSSNYNVLVVDEAAQAVELSSLIPMRFGTRQCVLVGDPQQLSATVFSKGSEHSLYERSLFERLESCNHPVHMLHVQYRSHPKISKFPREYFYKGLLEDGPNVQSQLYVRPYHNLGPKLQPLMFFNLRKSRETFDENSNSRKNIDEAQFAVNLYLTLKHSSPLHLITGQVGVITPYSQQQSELRHVFQEALGDQYTQEVEINTVDGFQGREKDIIILSTVRADPMQGIGFLNDIRRMNVALTRAKYACYVIGSESTLKSSQPWKAFLSHVTSSHCNIRIDNPKCNLLT